MLKVIAVSQVHFFFFDNAALGFTMIDMFRKAKRCTLSWKSGPKQRRLPREVKEVARENAVPDFLWRVFKVSITCLTGLCVGREAQTGRRGILTKIHCIAANGSCSGAVEVLDLSHACMNITDVHRYGQK